jgi:hypothetical protein
VGAATASLSSLLPSEPLSHFRSHRLTGDRSGKESYVDTVEMSFNHITQYALEKKNVESDLKLAVRDHQAPDDNGQAKQDCRALLEDR